MYKAKSVHQAVNEYFRLIPAGDLAAVVGLFANDAVVIPSPLPPTGPVKGLDAITDLYKGMIGGAPIFKELRMYDDGSTCVAEIRAEVGQDRRTLEAVDIFDLNPAGKISRMSVYKR